MSRTRWFRLMMPALALMVAMPLARAQGAPDASDSGLAQVPAQAPVVFYVKGIERTKDRLVTMIKNAVPDIAAQVQAKMDEGIKQALEGRELKGVPKDGPIFLILTEMPEATPDSPPPAAVIFRVTNYTEFRDAFLKEEERKTLKTDPAGYEAVKISDKDVYLVNRDGYAIATPQKDVAILFTKKQAGLDTKLDKDVAKKLLESDAGLYVDMTAVNKKYGDQLKQFRQLLPMLMGQVAQSGQVDKGQMEMIKKFAEGVFQLIDDARTFVVATDFRPEGFSLHTQMAVAADSKTNSLLKDAKPVALDGVAKLPAGHLGYWAMQVSPELLKAIQPLISGTMGADAKSAKVLQEALDEIASAEPRSTTVNFDIPPTEGMQVWDCKDPGKMAQGQLRLIQSLEEGGTYANAILKEKPKIKPDAENHRGFKLTSVSLVWDLEKMMEKSPGGKQMAEAMKKMMGEGGNAWFGSDGKNYVQVTAKNWESARRQLDEYLDGTNAISQNKAFQDTWKQLPAETTIVGLIDLPQYVAVIADFVGPVLQSQGLPINIPQLKASKGKTYLGMALVLQPTRGSVEIWFPGTAVNEIFKMVQQARGAGTE
jgi:hypothetical protein